MTYASKIDKAEARIDWSATRRADRTAGARVQSGPRRMVRGERRADKLLEAAWTGCFAASPAMVLDDCLLIACGEGRSGPSRSSGRDAEQ